MMENESAQASTVPRYLQQPEIVEYVRAAETAIQEHRKIRVIVNKTVDKMRIANCENLAFEMQTKANQIIDDRLQRSETATSGSIKTPATAGLIDRLRKSLGVGEKPETENERSDEAPSTSIENPYDMMEMAMFIRSGEYPYHLGGGNMRPKIIQIMREQEPSDEALWERVEAENPNIKRGDHMENINGRSSFEEQRTRLERTVRASLIRDLGPFEGAFAMKLLNDDISMKNTQKETYSAYVADTDFVGQFAHQKGVSGIYPQERVKFEHHTLCLAADANYLAIPIHKDFTKVQSYKLEEMEFAFTKLSNGKFRVQNLNEPTPDRDTALAGMSEEAMETAIATKFAVKENKEENQAGR